MENVFLLDLNFSIFRSIFQTLDIESKWRDLIAAADDTHYKLELVEVEECARAGYSNGSPSKQLLLKWGNSMKVSELIILLDRLRLERCQLFIREPERLRITVQPLESIQIKEGDRLELTTEASGFPYPVYSWFHADKQLSNSSSGKHVVEDVRVAHAGKYICRVHHANHRTLQLDYVFSDWCTVDILPCPSALLRALPSDGHKTLTITSHPVSQTVKLSHPLLLRCEARGTGKLQYHWVKNSMVIQYGPQYAVTSASATDSGNYYCIVRNGVDEIHSNVASIQIIEENGIQTPDKPQILQQPVDTAIELGGVALFTVKAHYCSELSYQWFHQTDTEHSVSIKGATSPELRVPVRGLFNAGLYQCRIYAPDGQEVLSRCARLTTTGDRQTYKAADKLALIIGVSTYRSHGTPLPAVEHDIQATVKVFEKMQFKVVSLLDLTLAEMKDAIVMFCDLLSPNVYAVFYCAGHGFMGTDGRHYLIPWDACLSTSPSESLCIENVEEQIQQRNPTLLMFFLDICRHRNSNLKEPPRIIRTGKAVPNRIVLYAASEGQQAYEESKKVQTVPRGLFNKYLLEVIDKPLEAVDLYKAIMDKFKTLPYDRDKYPQFPEMSANNEDYGRTLLDPIDVELYKTNCALKTSYWCLAHVIPPTKTFSIPNVCNGVLAFERITSNVMDLVMKIQQPPNFRVVIVLNENLIPSEVRPVLAITKGQPAGTSRYRFANLQRLRTNLMLSFNVRLAREVQGQSNNELVFKHGPIDLGKPLVAVLCLGQQPLPPATEDLSLASLSLESDSTQDDDDLSSDCKLHVDAAKSHQVASEQSLEYPSSLSFVG